LYGRNPGPTAVLSGSDAATLRLRGVPTWIQSEIGAWKLHEKREETPQNVHKLV